MSKLAIVIPYYKIDFFEKTLQSVSLQTNKNFVLYIGNDNSPDNPIPIINKYFAEGDFHYFNYKDNVGRHNLALQWERILENVQEEWFQILGDDDVISHNFVDECNRSISWCKENNIKVIKFTHDWIDENDNVIQSHNLKTDSFSSVDFIMRKHRREVCSSLSENIFTITQFRKFKFEKIPLAWGSDDIALLRYTDYGTICYNTQAYVGVRVFSGSISGSEEMQNNKEKAYNIYLEKIIINYSEPFPKEFIKKTVEEYLVFCHLNRLSPNYDILKTVFRKLNMTYFLKTLRKIYYLNKMSLKE